MTELYTLIDFNHDRLLPNLTKEEMLENLTVYDRLGEDKVEFEFLLANNKYEICTSKYQIDDGSLYGKLFIQLDNKLEEVKIKSLLNDCIEYRKKMFEIS